jgi:hypothetical protein
MVNGERFERVKVNYYTTNRNSWTTMAIASAGAQVNFFSNIFAPVRDLHQYPLTFIVQKKKKKTNLKSPPPPTGLPSSSGVFLPTSGRSF